MKNTNYKSINLFWKAIVRVGRIIHNRRHALYTAGTNMDILIEKTFL